MLLWKRVAGIGLVALMLNAGLILLPGGDRIGTAQAGGGQVVTDPSRTGDVTPTAGDPDGPTGDVAPPTHGSIDDPAGPIKQPVRRYSAWSEWKLAIRLWARFTFVR